MDGDQFPTSDTAPMVQELMGTVNRLAVALPEGKKPEDAARHWSWWLWRRSL